MRDPYYHTSVVLTNFNQNNNDIISRSFAGEGEGACGMHAEQLLESFQEGRAHPGVCYRTFRSKPYVPKLPSQRSTLYMYYIIFLMFLPTTGVRIETPSEGGESPPLLPLLVY